MTELGILPAIWQAFDSKERMFYSTGPSEDIHDPDYFVVQYFNISSPTKYEPC